MRACTMMAFTHARETLRLEHLGRMGRDGTGVSVVDFTNLFISCICLLAAIIYRRCFGQYIEYLIDTLPRFLRSQVGYIWYLTT